MQLPNYTYAHSDTRGAGAAGPGRQSAPGRGIYDIHMLYICIFILVYF